MRASLLVVIGLLGCEASADSRQSSPAERISAARARMHVRFAAAKAIQLAIGVGDLDRARLEAQRIASLDEPEFLPEWQPYLDEVRSTALAITTSQDAVTAAKAMGQLGAACGRCHAATSAKIELPRETAPVATDKLASQMASHQWAAARMWEGLIGAADNRWLEGATTLAGARLRITAESGTLGIADDAARTKLLARRARKLDARDERATLYGDLLATCAHCHATIRDRGR
jgi:hypothetical protein